MVLTHRRINEGGRTLEAKQGQAAAKKKLNDSARRKGIEGAPSDPRTDGDGARDLQLGSLEIRTRIIGQPRARICSLAQTGWRRWYLWDVDLATAILLELNFQVADLHALGQVPHEQVHFR